MQLTVSKLMHTKHPLRSRTPQTKKTVSLFTKGLAEWIVEPQLAFQSWLLNQGFGRRSFIVYDAQWGVFIQWCQAQELSLIDIKSAHIKQFLASLSDNKLNQRQRYLRLIERAYDAMLQSADTSDRSATQDLVNPVRSYQVLYDPYWKQAQVNDATFFYQEQLRSQLLEHMRSCTEWPSTRRLDPNGKAPKRNVRDRALACLFLLAGLKVSEALALRLSHISIKSETSIWIRVVGSAAHIARVQALTGEGARWMRQWLELRGQDTHSQQDSLLFATQKSAEGMHASTVARVMRDFFAPLTRNCPQIGLVTAQNLRNSYGAMLFDQAIDPDEVALRLGYAEVISAIRLQQAWVMHRNRLAS